MDIDIWSRIIDHSVSWLSFIVDQKWKNKIYKLGKVDDRIRILQPARSRNKRQEKKPRYESKKMVYKQAQKIGLKNCTYILE